VKKTFVLIFLVSLSLFAADDEFAMKQGKYTFTTEFQNNKTVVVYYALPMKFDRVVPSSASNIVFSAPYVGETKFFQDSKNYYVNKLGCTVFSFEYKYKDVTPMDRKNWYYYKESGWHDLMFKVQDQLIKDYGLTRKKLIIVGGSGGASMGQQMGIYYPDKIDAVAVVGGNCYDKPTAKTDVAWLMINTWGDRTTEGNDKFAEEASALDMQVLRVLTPPDYSKLGDENFHHIGSKIAAEYVHEFVKGIIEIRKKYHDILPSAEKWPVKYPSGSKVLNFPSDDFKKKWEELPHGFIKKMSYPSVSDEVVDYSGKNNKKIVLFLQDKKFSSITLMDHLYYLHELGYDVVTIDISMDIYGTCKERIIKALDYARNKAKLENKKLYAVGFWESGLTLLNETAKIKENSASKLIVFNPERNYYSDKTVDFPGGCECRVYYTEDYWDDKPVTGKSWCKEEVLEVNRDFGDNWFMFLKIILDEKEEPPVVVISDKARSLSSSQVDEIDRNLLAIERFLVKSETEIAKKMFEKLTTKYSEQDLGYVNPGTYKWIKKKFGEGKE